MSDCASQFARLDPRLQRWVWRERWTELREIQELAIPAILPAESDVLLAASTAAGKTEAAYLPALTRVATQNSRAGVRILNVSPLKALINDQFDRLELLAREVDIQVHRWHGDVPQAAKKRVLAEPAGVLLITPESLEAMFVLRGPKVAGLFAGLEYLVVDELHAFLGSERGRQLQNLLHRVELALRRRVPRIGLSATLGDLSMAAEALRPTEGSKVCICESDTHGPAPKIQLRGYIERQLGDTEDEHPDNSASRAIAKDLFQSTRLGHHLVFAGSRAAVETVTDLLRGESRRQCLPEVHHPHHGNLSKEIREATEAALKDRSRPATAVSTSTLELGIDIGTLESVAQVGSAPSVASLRQRLGRSGRSGRREAPSVLTGYCRETALDQRTPLPDALRLELVEAVSQIELLLEGWCEPPRQQALHLSTLVQQILSVIAQHGGASPAELHRALCESGPFRPVHRRAFAALLRAMGEADWLAQDATGLLLTGPVGEKIVNHYDFYSAFLSPEEYAVSDDGRRLGTIGVDPLLTEGVLILFAGRRWRVVRVDHRAKSVEVVPSGGGRVPAFSGRKPGAVHDVVRQRMRALLSSEVYPSFLDQAARTLLAEGRSTWRRLKLECRYLVEADGILYGIPWLGDRAVHTLLLALRTVGIQATIDHSGALLCFSDLEITKLRSGLAQVAECFPDPLALAEIAKPGPFEKFHAPLTQELIELDWASSQIDREGGVAAARALLSTFEA